MVLNFLYDTNVIIYHLKNDFLVKKYFEEKFLNTNRIFISSISRIELLSFPELSKEENKKINQLLNEFDIISLNDEIEDSSIKLKKKYKIKIPDAIILATAHYLNATLLTADKSLYQYKNYIKIKSVL